MGSTGQLIWSVNLSPASNDLAAARDLQHGARETLKLLRQHQMPATWTAADPAAIGSLCHEILAEPGHELGLLGDASWIGAGRTTFVNELTRRSETARAAGLPLNCLATGGASLENNLDVLVRHRIATIRVDGAQWRMASSRRFGIWQMSVTDVVPGRPGMRDGRWGYRRMIRQCAKQQQTILLVIEGAQMADASKRKLLENLCRYAAKQSQLTVPTFGQLAHKMLAPNTAAGAGSILRAA